MIVAVVQERLVELHRLWDLLLRRLQEKGLKLQQALRLIQFMRECDKLMFWISDKEMFVTTDEFGQDLEHVEVLQKKFEEFQKDLQNQEERVANVNQLADKLIDEQHPEEETVRRKQAVSALTLALFIPSSLHIKSSLHPFIDYTL